MNCVDCGKEILPGAGRPPKRCPEHAKAQKRVYCRQYRRSQRAGPDLNAIYKYIEKNAPVSAPEIYKLFPGISKDFGSILAKLQAHGYYCWLDEKNQIHPYRRIKEDEQKTEINSYAEVGDFGSTGRS
jgi:hypothetical protein